MFNKFVTVFKKRRKTIYNILIYQQLNTKKNFRLNTEFLNYRILKKREGCEGITDVQVGFVIKQ